MIDITKIFGKIRSILKDEKLDLADKICEIESVIPEKQEKVMTTVFGAECEVRKEGNTIIFDGSAGVEYTDNPRFKHEDDLYYTGCGCTWDTDLDGERYWLRYSPFVGGNLTRDSYSHLGYGDIINEQARIKKIVMECLNEIGKL